MYHGGGQAGDGYLRGTGGESGWDGVGALSSIEMGEEDPRPDYVLKNVIDLPSLLPKNPKVPRFRSKLRVSMPDLDDSNSNGSDGS